MELKKQNILFLTRTMALGGTENVILQLCEILKPLVNNIVVCSSGGINVSKLEEMNIKHYTNFDIENKNPINIIKNIKSIKRILKEENITIVHSHHRMAALYANLCCNNRIIKIANAHNTFYNRRFLTKLAYRNTQIIAVGEQVKKNLTEYFKIEKKCVNVIHNAIKSFNKKIVVDETIKKLKEDGNIVVANVGRLSEQKGMEYYIKACTLLKEKCKKVKYLIVGSGEDEDKLKKLVYENKMEDYIYFLGFRADIQNILSQVDFVVLSSLWEGLPLTPIEAFSVGKTIVATNVDGTPEIVINDKNGLLVEPKDFDGLAESMMLLIKNDKIRRRLEKCALDTYIKEFSFDILSKEYINYYINCVGEKYEKK